MFDLYFFLLKIILNIYITSCHRMTDIYWCFSRFQEITELKEQVRDLMFFLEAQNTIDKSVDREDIVNGSVIVEQQNSSGQNKTQKSKKHR